MRKVKQEQFQEAFTKHNGDPKKISQELGLSYSNTCWKIRNLEQAKNPAKVEAFAVNREDKNSEQIIGILETKIDIENLIPEVDVNYQMRKEVDDKLEIFSARGENPALIGEAGTGKTYAVEQFAARKNLPFLRIACDDTATLKEYLGRREIINGTTYFRTGIFLELVQQPSVILIDEFNAIHSSRLFFLHELLDNRRLFIKDAEGGKVINLHKDCKIFLACNPNTARYSCTQKINAALGDRVVVIPVEPFNSEKIKHFFDTGAQNTTDALKNFYNDAVRMINEQGLRVVFSLRGVKRIANAIKSGDNLADALAFGFYNVAHLVANKEDKESLEKLARVHFGIEAFNQAKEE